MSGALDRKCSVDATVAYYCGDVTLARIRGKFPGINREIVDDLFKKLPVGLPFESVDSRKVRREAWKALGGKADDEASNLSTNTERRSALSAVLTRFPAMSIVNAVKEFGISNRTIKRDMESIRKSMGFESNKKMRADVDANLAKFEDAIKNIDFGNGGGPKPFLSQAEIDLLAFMGDELDQHGTGKDRRQMAAMSKNVIDAKAREDIEIAEHMMQCHGVDTEQYEIMIDKAEKMLSTKISRRWVGNNFGARTSAIAAPGRQKSFS